MKPVWKQWDKQEKERWENQAFIEMNNLYLAIERGAKLTIHTSNRLRILLSRVYSPRTDQTIIDYWMDEFTKLPNWNNV